MCGLLHCPLWLVVIWCLLLPLPNAAACTSARPLKVAVDIGHSRSDPGATSASGKTEYEFNRRFATELVERSRRRAALDLFLVNPTGRQIMLRARTREAETLGADVFLSLHHDSVNDRYIRTTRREDGRLLGSTDAFRGYSIFVHEPAPRFAESLALAKRIGREFKNAGMMQTLHHAEPIPGEGRKLLSWELGIYDAPFAVLKSDRLPSVLVELGVITNPVEEKVLELPEYRGRLAESILAALEATCGARRF